MRPNASVATEPWYRVTRRWGQTNLTEIDPADYDSAWWVDHWRKTHVQGVIVNAGGIVAYYPSGLELQYRAEYLGKRDLFGEIVQAARSAGLAVLARMDSNRATEAFFQAHPDWFARNREGEPCRAGDRYQACVNTPYYKEFLPSVLREIIERYRPDGFTDNSWGGLGRNYVCHCDCCREKFRAKTGMELPAAKDWSDPAWRLWVRESYLWRLENWDLNNLVCQEAGGPDCLWLGMVNGNPAMTHCSFCDLKEVGARSKIVMCDHQSRDKLNGFEQNGLNGKTLHGVAGWDTLIPESMAMYVRGDRAFRRAANPAAEAHTWMIEGYAGGISPWWHHVGARQDDRRQFLTAQPLMDWHLENEEYLGDRTPVANIGVAWSQINLDFYGRDEALEKVAMPWRGWAAALTRARLPWLPVHLDHVERDADRLDVLILPDLGAMNDAQIEAVRAFALKGGSVIATGKTGLGDEWGDPRADFALADIFGVSSLGRSRGVDSTLPSDWERHLAHNYLRLLPESEGYNDPRPVERHPVLEGFGLTDILPLGGTVHEIEAAGAVETLATYVPAFPIYPPEFSWMREPRTTLPALVARRHPAGGRHVYFAADVDRCHGRHLLPDHATLLANAIRWAVDGREPLRVDGPGYLDCHLWRQGARLILHVVNLTGLNVWPGYAQEHYTVGPLRLEIALPEGIGAKSVRRLVKKGSPDSKQEDRRLIVHLDSVEAHEVLVIE
jgi:hypothetical protein